MNVLVSSITLDVAQQYTLLTRKCFTYESSPFPHKAYEKNTWKNGMKNMLIILGHMNISFTILSNKHYNQHCLNGDQMDHFLFKDTINALKEPAALVPWLSTFSKRSWTQKPPMYAGTWGERGYYSLMGE